MLQVKKLTIMFCLMATSASASVVVKGIETLSPQEEERVFGILIKREHDLERVVQINADITAALPNKNLNAYWVPDTLYQIVQSYFDVQGLNPQGSYLAKQARFDPQYHMEAKKMGDALKTVAAKPHWFKDYKYPTTLDEHKALNPLIASHWARFNKVADTRLTLANFQIHGSHHALSKIFERGPQFQLQNEKRGLASDKDRWTKHTAHLQKNEAFLRHALTVEEEAHNEGKFLLWRYTQPLAGEFPDLPFTMRENSLEKTLRAPLEYHALSRPRVSYASRLLEGFFGDGTIYGLPYDRTFAPACTFSFLANDVAIKAKGGDVPNPIVYSLALSPEKIKELNDRFYLHYPREAMPQHIGIYGTEESFHPNWLLDYGHKENVQAWLGLMQSDALRIHLVRGNLQNDYKDNPEVQRVRDVYRQFLNKARVEAIAAPVKPVQQPQKPAQKPIQQPQKPALSFSEVAKKRAEEYYKKQAEEAAKKALSKPIVQVKRTSVVQARRVPVIQARKTPVVQANRAPAVQARRTPVVQTRKASVVQVRRTPVVQARRVPSAQARRTPVVQARRTPVVQARRAPSVQARRTPVVQARRVPSVQARKIPVRRINNRR